MTKDKYIEYLRVRAKAARPVRKSRHAACLVYKGRILSEGINLRKSHPMMLQFQDHPEKIWLHAEVSVIIKCINEYGVDILKKCHLYVVRTNALGELMPSKPCKGCQKAINAFDIKKVTYS